MDLDLTAYHIIRPEKIAWRFPQGVEPLAGIPSKSLRKFLRTLDSFLVEQQITVVYRPLTREYFLSFLAFYKERTQEYGYTQFIDEAWYPMAVARGDTLYELALLQHGEYKAGGIIIIHGDKATLGYSARTHEKIQGYENASFGAILDYLFLVRVHEQGILTISAGKSRNAFGVINHFGHLEFKLRMGYIPLPAPDTLMLQSVPVNQQGRVMFFGLQDEKLSLYVVQPEGEEALDMSAYKTQHIPIERLFYSPIALH